MYCKLETNEQKTSKKSHSTKFLPNIGNLNVLGNGYLEDPKKWWVVASWV